MGLFDWLRAKVAGASGEPAHRSTRRYEVTLFGESLGEFALPVGDSPRRRPILTRPFRADLLDSAFFYWVEPNPDGSFRTVTWHPETPELLSAAEHFYRTAHAHPLPTPGRTAEELQLVRAIRADRDAEQPYRDYAAWLAARGEAYGEYIRLTLEVEGLPEGDECRERLEVQRAKLVREHGPRWVRPLTDLGHFPGEPVVADGFRPDDWYGPKGVIEELEVGRDVVVLTDNWPRLFAAAPFLRKLTVCSSAATVADIADIPELSQLDALALQLADGTTDDFRRFAESSHLGGLRDLRLANYRCGPVAARHLASAAWLSGVRTIDLRGNAMGDDGAEAWAASPHVANLTHADLGGNDFTDRGLIALSRSPHLAKLTALSVGGSAYGEAGVKALTAAPFAPVLAALDLSDSGLDSGAVNALASGSFPAFKSLDLGGNAFGAEGWQTLAAAPWFARLERFGAGGCGLGDAGAHALASRGPLALRELDLRGNEITDAGVIALARSGAFGKLTALRLGHNPFELSGVSALAAADLPALEELDLSRVRVGRAGALALAASPHLKKLRRLVVTDEFVGVVGRVALVGRFTERVVSWA